MQGYNVNYYRDTVNPHSVYHRVLSKRPRSGIVVKYQGGTRNCPGKFGHFPAKIPSWTIDEMIVKFHGQLFLMAHGTLSGEI
jgi:hypothetical protein